MFGIGTIELIIFAVIAALAIAVVIGAIGKRRS
jgi:hypothetical protein